MIIALTGATGFLGGQVVDALLGHGHQIRALTRRPQPVRDGVTWVAGALADEAALAVLCRDVQAVIHVAGVVNAPDAAGFDSGNRLGTLAMLHAAEAAHAGRFVHVSSLAAREPQLSLYGASKRAGENAVVLSSLDWRIVRPTAIYGPGDKELLEVFRYARRGLVPLPPGGRMSVIHVEDMARLIVAMVEGGSTHAVYEADDGMPGGWAHRDFVAAVGSAVGRRPLAVPMPRSVLGVAARIDGAIRGSNAKLTRDRVDYLTHPDWTIDPAKAVPSDLWRPRIATAAGLAATAQWYRQAGWL